MTQDDPLATAQAAFEAIERGWNAGDGTAFAEPFTDDADFVDIRGVHHRSRAAIAGGHQAIFDSIYKGSSVRYEVTTSRALAPGVVLAHAGATLEVPGGPLAGTHAATPSIVLVHDGDAWRIAAFHNTRVQE